MSPTCLLWCGCHSYGRCLATAHWAFSSYGRLEAERVNQFWWNLVHDSKLRLQWQLHNQILTAAILENVGNGVTGLPMEGLRRNLGDSISSCPGHVRRDAVAMARAVPSNGALNIQQLWASGGRTREPNLMKFGMQTQIRTTMTVTLWGS